MQVEDIIQRMQRDKRNFRNHVVNFAGIEFRRSSGVPRIEFTERLDEEDIKTAYLLSPEAYAGICAYANEELKAGLVSAIDEDSISELLVNSFLTGAEGQIQIITGTDPGSGGQVITSLVSPDVAVIPDLDVYDSLVSISEITGVRLDDMIEVSNGHIMRFVTDSQVDVRPSVGDVIQSGFEVFNSPRGLSPGYVASYIKRLACTNGMTRTETKITARMVTKDRNTILNALRDGAMVAVGKFDEDIVRINNLIGQEVPNPEAMIHSLGQEFGIPQRDVTGAIGALNEEPDIRESMWGVLNAFTRWANNSELPWDSRYKLQRTAFDIVERDYERCDNCGSLHPRDAAHSH
jgi:hypothetical protein